MDRWQLYFVLRHRICLLCTYCHCCTAQLVNPYISLLERIKILFTKNLSWKLWINLPVVKHATLNGECQHRIWRHNATCTCISHVMCLQINLIWFHNFIDNNISLVNSLLLIKALNCGEKYFGIYLWKFKKMNCTNFAPFWKRIFTYHW